jgi:S1-C subfamily serine protease
MRGDGTGIALSAEGEVLTNNHVIDGATTITVTDLGNGQRYQGSVAGYDRSLDIAVVTLTGAVGLPTIRLGDSSRLKIGEGVVALGNAQGRGGAPSAAAGSLVALDRRVIAEDKGGGNPERLSGLIGVDAAVQPGDSGGPLVDAAGQTIGITTAGNEHPRRFWGACRAYAIPIRQALWVATQVMTGKPSAGVHIGPTAFLGVGLVAGGAKETAQAVSGATISGVLRGSPADQAGLVAGDRLTSLAGQPIDSPTTLASALDRCRPAQRVTLGWADLSGLRHAASVQLVVGPAG